MEVLDALNNRYTCRAFKNEPVKEDTIVEILEHATRSPSWANTQPWELFVAGGEVLDRIRNLYLEYFNLENPSEPELQLAIEWPEKYELRMKELGIERYKHLEIKRDDAEARKESWKRNFQFFGAPTVIYICMESILSEWSIFDLGSLSQSIMLAAQGLGVDTAPAVNLVVYPDIIRDELKIPDELSIVFGIAIGYGDSISPQNTYRTPRRPLDEVAHFKGF
jgi:nitroreductase